MQIPILTHLKMTEHIQNLEDSQSGLHYHRSDPFLFHGFFQ